MLYRRDDERQPAALPLWEITEAVSEMKYYANHHAEGGKSADGLDKRRGPYK